MMAEQGKKVLLIGCKAPETTPPPCSSEAALVPPSLKPLLTKEAEEVSIERLLL